MAIAVFSFLALTSCVQGKDKADASEQLADKIVESQIPVLVDFWAAWCAPCRYLDPIIADLEKEYKGRVEFMKVDVDIHKALTAYFRVTAVPSVYIIEDKTVRTAIPGVRDKKTYKEAIESALKLSAERSKKKPQAEERQGKECTNC
jgi:thioredoxin 1